METKKRKRNETFENEIKNLVRIDKLFEERQTVDLEIQKYRDEIDAMLEKLIASEDKRDEIGTEISLLEKTPIAANQDVGRNTLIEFLNATKITNCSIPWNECTRMYSIYCHQNTCKMMSLRSKNAQDIFSFHSVVIVF